MNNNTNIFNVAASNYDENFTFSHIGVLQRERVYHWLDKINFFSEPKTIFEINCGTGYDAEIFTQKGHSVIATDGSEAMVEIARKTRNKNIDFFQLPFSKLAENEKFNSSEVLFSNFGGLNCISETKLGTLVKNISTLQKQQDLLIWTLMPKFCLIESLYFLLKLNFKKAFRRNSKHSVPVNVEGIAIDTYYHSPKTMKSILAKDYKIKLIKPVAIFLPPSYMESFCNKNKQLLHFLNIMESICGRFSFLANFSDHYIIIAEKK